MKKMVVVALAILVIAALMLPVATASTTSMRVGIARKGLESFTPKAMPGEVVVKFKKSATRASTRSTIAAVGAASVAGPVARLSVVKAAAGHSVSALIESLQADPNVAYAEPNYLRYLSMTPNDTRFTQQWGLNNTGQLHPMSSSNLTRLGTADADMDVTEAWDTQQGDADTVVAIMDSGVDVSHPDLIASMWVNPGEVAGNNVDDDGNGYTDDINGWDFAADDDSLLQNNSALAGWDHGTHVAGIVGATENNGIGVSGVCPNCKLMVLKMFEPFDIDGDGVNDTMVGDLAGELKAFDYAIDMGADVINGSFGASIVSSRSERAAIKRAIAAGITTVFAAGNENGDNDLLLSGVDFDGDEFPDMTSPAYPASYDLNGLIAVAASNDQDMNAFQSACFEALGEAQWPCTFTNWGHDSVDVSAPGVDIMSTLPDNTYDSFDGTSMAAPAVAGVAGLIKAEHPDYTPAQVANAIMNSADLPASLQSLLALPDSPVSAQVTVTGGRVNAAAALSAPTTDNFPVSDGTVTGARTLNTSVTDSVSWPEDTNDVFKKKLTKGVVYKAVLNTVGAGDLDLQIYKPGTQEIWQFDDRCFGGSGCSVLYYEPTSAGDVKVRFKATKTATYFFHVNSWLLEADNYSLKVTKV